MDTASVSSVRYLTGSLCETLTLVQLHRSLEGQRSDHGARVVRYFEPLGRKRTVEYLLFDNVSRISKGKRPSGLKVGEIGPCRVLKDLIALADVKEERLHSHFVAQLGSNLVMDSELVS